MGEKTRWSPKIGECTYVQPKMGPRKKGYLSLFLAPSIHRYYNFCWDFLDAPYPFPIRGCSTISWSKGEEGHSKYYVWSPGRGGSVSQDISTAKCQIQGATHPNFMKNYKLPKNWKITHKKIKKQKNNIFCITL